VSRKVIVRRLAEGHLTQAYTWYESRALGLGADFLHAFESVLP
jgi:hypothetical protein